MVGFLCLTWLTGACTTRMGVRNNLHALASLLVVHLDGIVSSLETSLNCFLCVILVRGLCIYMSRMPLESIQKPTKADVK